MSSPNVDQLKQTVQQETAIANARALITGINDHCYEKCIPKPGATMSKGEETCYTMCMEKFMQAWNTVGRTYVARLQKENQQQTALSATAGLGI
ncbi:hypothetical protein MRB53_038793 [Persea americana]|nr:hypothetical protein MRB53_038793 [Persea americana]